MGTYNPRTQYRNFLTGISGITDFTTFMSNVEAIWGLDGFLSEMEASGIFNVVISDTQPTDTTAIWVDPSDPPTGAASAVKMYNPTTGGWQPGTFELFATALNGAIPSGASPGTSVAASSTVNSSDGEIMINPTGSAIIVGGATTRSALEAQGFVTLVNYIASAFSAGDLVSGTSPNQTIDDPDLKEAILNDTLLVSAPVGVIFPFAGVTIPSGWLLCDGSSFTSLPLLEAVLGGTTLPDLRGEFLRGNDNGRGIDPGRGLLSFQNHQFQTHRHDMASERGSPDAIIAFSDNDNTSGYNIGSTRGDSHFHVSDPNSGNYGSETRPRSVSVNFIIKHD